MRHPKKVCGLYALFRLCTPSGSIIKSSYVKAKKALRQPFTVTVEPAFVKWYRKALANRGFCKKKPDTRFDTHCIKTGVRLCKEVTKKKPIRRERKYCKKEEPQPHICVSRLSTGAPDRNRTCTVSHRILNPARLPVPPQVRDDILSYSHLRVKNTDC